MATIAAASKSRIRISQVEESTRGTTPTNPQWTILPHLDSTAMNQTQTFERSNQVKSNRMGGEQIGGNIESVGNIAVPLKNDTGVRRLLESLFSLTFSNVSVSGTGGNPSGFAFVTAGSKASGTIQITTNVDDNDEVVVNGVTWTFKNSPTLSSHILIGGNANTTASNLQAALAASTNPLLTVAKYTVITNTVTVRYGVTGVAGNAFTLAKTDVDNDITLSGATLTGGVDGSDSITRTSGSFINDGFHVGDQITVTAATTTLNNIANADLVTIAALTATAMTLSTTADINTAETFATGTTLTSRSFYGKAGSIRHYFTYEVAYLDLSPVVYEYFRGLEANTGTINLPTSGEVTMECAMVGNSGEITNTQFTLGSGAYNPAASTKSFAGSVTGSQLLRSGVSSPEVESLTININNNRASKFAVGQQYAALVEEGDFDAELSMSLYFADKSVQEAYLAGTRSALEVAVADQSAGHKLVLEFPTVVFTTGDKGVSGQTVTQNVTAFAEEDATHTTKCRVWVIPAASAT